MFFFSSDFESVFAEHLTGKIWALIFIQRPFTLSVSFGFDGPPLLTFKIDRLDLKEKWRERLTSLNFQRVYAAYYIYKPRVWKHKTPVLHNNSASYTRITFLN